MCCIEPTAISLVLITHTGIHTHTRACRHALYPYYQDYCLPTDSREKGGKHLEYFMKLRSPISVFPTQQTAVALSSSIHTHTHTPENRNNVLNAIIVRPKQCHLSREHLGLYNKFHIINTIFHPLSSLSDLWHTCDLR